MNLTSFSTSEGISFRGLLKLKQWSQRPFKMLPHLNAMPQTQDIPVHSITDSKTRQLCCPSQATRHGARQLCCPSQATRHGARQLCCPSQATRHGARQLCCPSQATRHGARQLCCPSQATRHGARQLCCPSQATRHGARQLCCPSQATRHVVMLSIDLRPPTGSQCYCLEFDATEKSHPLSLALYPSVPV